MVADAFVFWSLLTILTFIQETCRRIQIVWMTQALKTFTHKINKFIASALYVCIAVF